MFVDELAAKLARLPFVAVVGRSGSGKSSLVRAALLPRLHDGGAWRILVMRPGAPSADPFRNLAVCLLDAARDTGTGLAAMLDEDAVATLAPRCTTIRPCWPSTCAGLPATARGDTAAAGGRSVRGTVHLGRRPARG